MTNFSSKNEVLEILEKTSEDLNINIIDTDLKDDQDVMYELIKSTFSGADHLTHVSKRLLNDLDFAKKIASLRLFGALNYFSDSIKDNEEAVIAFIQDKNMGAEIRFASDRVKSIKKIMKLALISNSMSLQYALIEQKRDPELVWSAMFEGGNTNDPIAFLFADISLRKDHEFYKKITKKIKEIKVHKDLVNQIKQSHLN